MEETEVQQTPMISKVIAGGDTATIYCPEGSTPSLKAGDLLPNAEDAQFFITAVADNGFTVGPLKAGTFELAYRCSNNEEYKTSIEIPYQEPDKLPPKEGPLDLVAFNLWWLWAVLIAAIIAAFVAALVYQRKKHRAKQQQKQKEAKVGATQRDPQQLLRDMIAKLELVEKSPMTTELKSDELYQKGYRSVRGFLEKELKLKTQAETTPQFIGSLKIIGAKLKIPTELLNQIERSLVLSDQNRFGAASSDSPEFRKQYASDLKLILQSLLKLSVQWQVQPSASTKGTKR